MSKDFKRQENWKYKRFGDKWRKGRGSKSPLRRGKSGRAAQPATGFGSPKSERGLHPTGLREVMVFNSADLGKVNPKTDIARIGGTVGLRKKIGIFLKAKIKKIKVVQHESSCSKKNSK